MNKVVVTQLSCKSGGICFGAWNRVDNNKDARLLTTTAFRGSYRKATVRELPTSLNKQDES